MLSTLARTTTRTTGVSMRRAPSSLSSLPASTQVMDGSGSRSIGHTTSSGYEQEPRENSLLTHRQGVHQTVKVSKSWRNKPLFRRQGDVRFKTGIEAAELLVGEAKRRDDHETTFIDAVDSTMKCLSPIFDRNPKYAFVAKSLMEPERFMQFRVAWIDDVGVVRMNRGFRVQYSSSIGPYEGALHFGRHVDTSVVKALGFDAVFSNAVTGFDVGAAVGGSDFYPEDKSEGELQRFCQSYMTELSKYVGPDIDSPWMGMGVGEKEMGYMFGQYKRIGVKSSVVGRPFLSFSNDLFYQAPGYGVVHFANQMLQDRKEALKGKRCLILGSGKVARSVAEKLVKFGAIPLTFTDMSGHLYEPDGLNAGKLKTINSIKQERGALLGRYIISSTSAQFNDPADIFDIPCDLCFPCGAMNEVTVDVVNKLADNGCLGVIEGGHACVTATAREKLRKRGLLYGPHTMTMTGPAIVHSLGLKASDDMLAKEVARIYDEVKRNAQEFNARGDLHAGAHILGFLRVANMMMNHGAV